MQKFKIPLIAGGVIAILSALLFYFLSGDNTYRAIPASAVAVVEVNNWKQFSDKLGSTIVGAELKKTETVTKLLAQVSTMQGLLAADASLSEAIGSGKTIVSVHLTSATDYDFLFTTELNGINDNTILNHLQASPRVKSVSVRVFKGEKVVDVFLRNGGQVSFAKQGAILSYSFTSFLTESSMTATGSGDNLAKDKSFKVVKGKATHGKDVNLYFNLKKAAVIFPVLVKGEKLAQLSGLGDAGDWARYDLSFDNEKMELDGTIASDKAFAGSDDLLAENLISKIPAHAAFMQLNRNDTTGASIALGYFKQWMGYTHAFVILEPLRDDFNEQNVFLLGIKDKQRALNGLRQLAGEEGRLPVDTFLSTEIYMLPDGAVINEAFKSKLITFKSPVYAVLNGAVVFCNNLDVLKLLLAKTGNGETLDKDKDFEATAFARYTRNSGMLYMNFDKAGMLLRGMFKENSTALPLLSCFKNLLAISNANKGKVSSRMVFAFGGGGKATSGLKWRTGLKTTANSQPFIVTNYNSGEKEIILQDTAFNVYLLSRSGEILFMKNIGEPILGTISQVDYYNNGKLQYIFNSARHVFVIDRLGNDVGAYPLRLSSTASTGMTLVKDGGLYRYFVPCVNGSVYGYEANGRPLSGWSPRSGIGIADSPVVPVVSGSANLLAMQNNTGRLMLLDMKGNQKWSVDNLPVGFVAVKQGAMYKFLIAEANQLIEIDFDGNEKLKPLIDSAHSLAAVVAPDSGYCYYYSTGNQVRGYNHLDEFKFATTVAGKTISSISNIHAGTDQYLLMDDSETQQLFIYDFNLKPLANFNYTGANTVVVCALFGPAEIDAITLDEAANVSCYRVK